MTAPVRVRIAPSPTGDPHVGTAYIALFNYAFAKSQGGTFILRIEDTDQTRSTKESEDAILRALRWIGLQWDEGPDNGGPHGPYRQSERTAIYQEHAQILINNGRAYRCFCTKERIEELRAVQKAQKLQPGYDGKCRALSLEESDVRANAGESFVVRLAMPKEGKTVFRDRLRGDVEFANAQMDDQVLLKADSFPTYHLANVVDDHLMGVTHVIRAEEWLSSTPKHVELYKAFGWESPEWIHMPLLRNKDKSKISKRKNPVSLDYYRDAGILPEALRNFLGLMGWSMPAENDQFQEKFTLQEMIDKFSIDRVHLGGPVFDLEKLWAINGMYIRDLSQEQLLQRLLSWRLSADYLGKLVPLVKERMSTLCDFVSLTDFFFAGDLQPKNFAQTMVPKGKTAAELAAILSTYVERLDEERSFSAARLQDVSKTFCEENGWKPKDFYMPVRIAITGRTTTPPLFESMEMLGKELCRRRIRLAIAQLQTL
jgi:glutamyl-tRNA synthetase